MSLAIDLCQMANVTNRRQALRLLAGSTLIPLVGCGGSERSAASGSGGSAGNAGSGAGGSGGTDPTSCSEIPDETGGPYPGDGTNGVNALGQTGIVRSDIRPSFGSLSGSAAGVTTTFEVKLVDVNAKCAPLAGYAIYIWHCDHDGDYSLYTATEQNYLRGVQETDANGVAKFTSIFPGCYSGRWPHVHFEVFESLAKATNGANGVKTSQLALPESACKQVYATSGYEASASNLSDSSLSDDMVFSDGATTQIATVSGNASDGYVVSLIVGIAV